MTTDRAMALAAIAIWSGGLGLLALLWKAARAAS